MELRLYSRGYIEFVRLEPEAMAIQFPALEMKSRFMCLAALELQKSGCLPALYPVFLFFPLPVIFKAQIS